MKNTKEINPRDGQTESPWQSVVSSVSDAAYASTGTGIFDVIIVGAGITGLTTALLLQKAGKKCLILEAGKVGFGTTGGTSAHLNTFFDATYPEIESDFGKQAAKQVADSGKEAMAIIDALVKEYGIDCDLEYKDGYLFSENEKETVQLREILEASKRAGIAVAEVENNDVPVPFKLAIGFAHQGQFHPLKYINGLLKAFQQLGGTVIENCFVSAHKELDNGLELVAGEHTFQAGHLIYATHLPPGITAFSFRCAPYRSYVLGLRLKDKAENYPTGLAYDMQEPYHYFRTHVVDGERLLIVGGEDHKTGHDDPEQAFVNLEKYARQYYQVESVVYRWSSQYYVPVDGLPYIGRLGASKGNIYIATGFNGNGMIFGTISGKIISDQILGVENLYGDLYAPARLKPVAGFSEFVKENADVAWHFVADRFGTEDMDKLSELKNGEGKIAEFKGQKLAVYKDQKGKVTALSPVCTHAGCFVNFNTAEQSWDCPCHGGRFDTSGKVICGPPRTDLLRVDI
ncbi:FAD-dependent oxidoreductase [Pedobacter antarcticus]|uniref:FAD-dependent oxidoreductase n=1 Tax=Pedobacter antarcticus TaxID=34086 RepID=UPI00087FDA43|nr:FAD-dependent oxidoreductase [Pedobacter antarcticus]SDL38220.1 Rieske [2Fe-2S] domain-containing protein [Pedobacter antarcticus]